MRVVPRRRRGYLFFNIMYTQKIAKKTLWVGIKLDVYTREYRGNIKTKKKYYTGLVGSVCFACRAEAERRRRGGIAISLIR